MPKSPESKDFKNKNESGEFTPEEASLRIHIEREIIKRSPIKDVKIWMEEVSKKFDEVFLSHKEEIFKLYAENPEAAYKKIEDWIDEK